MQHKMVELNFQKLKVLQMSELDTKQIMRSNKSQKKKNGNV